jgi:hypothetical protein
VPKITWPIVVIMLGLLATIDIIMVTTKSYESVAPIVNILGVLLIGMFARDSVASNKESAARVDKAASQTYILAADAEHQATLARISAIEAKVHADSAKQIATEGIPDEEH